MISRLFRASFVALVCLKLVVFSNNSFAANFDAVDEIDSGLHEPLFIDLVRPINSKKGQFEVNSLCYAAAKSDSKVACSPEVEYAIADGLGIELELPMDYNGKLKEIKTAVQKKLDSSSFSKRYEHGIQVIAEQHVQDRGNALTFYYIAGYNKRDVSLMLLNGLRRKSNGTYSGLVNYSIYKNFSQNFAYGAEFNYDQKGSIKRRFLPQLKLHLSSRYELQAGVGFENRFRSDSLLSALRVIALF